jgi:hypothetical protein
MVWSPAQAFQRWSPAGAVRLAGHRLAGWGSLLVEAAQYVATDGTVTGGPYPQAIGGLTVVEVPSRKEALEWAAKIAVACRCAQEVREFGPDPELDEMLRARQTGDGDVNLPV